MTTPQDPEYRPPQQPYTPAPPPLSESELAGYPGQAAPSVPEPKEVRLSFFLWIAGAVLLLVSAILVITQRDVAIQEARKTNTAGVTPDQLESAVTAVLWGLVVVGVVLAALMALFAVKARAGRNWARIALTVLGVIVALYHLIGFSLLGLLIVLVVVAAVVTMYLPASKAYFDSVKRAG
ncbi:hypothetical protein AB0G02_03235 [Actinosynnema sp. NPDC023658]|uniref:hypothetical protein n=1 Tax=Actinosynnema sp. NPDC023658 TaxID=3155465 RepID=UPI0033F83C80